VWPDHVSVPWNRATAGNRLWERSPTQTTYLYNVATQRLTSTIGASADTFEYDNVGRLTSDSRGAYTYKPSGLLASVTAPSVAASYEYDPEGLRTSRTVNGQTSYAIRSAGGDILSEYAVPCGGALVWTKDTIYAAGRPLGAVKATVVQPSIEFVNATLSVSEGQTATLSARLTTPTGQPLSCAATAAYETTAQTAKEGEDFTRTAGVLTFPAGSANGATTPVSLALTMDALDEPNETFQLILSPVTGSALGAMAEATITVVDDDPTPTLTVGDVMVTEGQSGSSNAVFTVSLSAVSGQDVQATYATAPGTRRPTTPTSQVCSLFRQEPPPRPLPWPRRETWCVRPRSALS
jgi:YD repeat-containing protein